MRAITAAAATTALGATAAAASVLAAPIVTAQPTVVPVCAERDEPKQSIDPPQHQIDDFDRRMRQAILDMTGMTWEQYFGPGGPGCKGDR